MKTYDLYVETGPKMRKMIVHVPALDGCTARGDTTDAAIAAAPAAVRAFLRLLARSGEDIDAAAPFKTRVAAQMMEGGFLGSIFLETDLKPLTRADAERSLSWLGWLHAGLRDLTAALPPERWDAKPASGRTIRQILQHVCGEGAYLRGVSGASRIQREVEERRLDPNDALDRLLELEAARLRSMTAAERGELVMRGQSQWTARCAVRKMLGHAWEHYVEIAERLGVEL